MLSQRLGYFCHKFHQFYPILFRVNSYPFVSFVVNCPRLPAAPTANGRPG
jgi:hypothetical protein